MDHSLLKSKKAQVKSRPSQIVTKSLSMLMDIDTRIIDKLSDSEKEKLHSQLHRLTDAVSLIEEEVTSDGTVLKEEPEEKIPEELKAIIKELIEEGSEQWQS